MIEAAMIWNEPNNKSHWDPALDPDWSAFARMTILSAQAIRAENATLPRVLGGMSPIDPTWVQHLDAMGVLGHLEAVAVHGFPLDWNLWALAEWPRKIDEIRAVTSLPVWVSEVGVSTFGAEEVQEWGLKRTAELLVGRAQPHPLVLALRPAEGVGSHDPSQGSGRILLLSALRHGATSPGWHPEARCEALRRRRHPPWGSANGSISRTIVLTKQWNG